MKKKKDLEGAIYKNIFLKNKTEYIVFEGNWNQSKK